MRRSDQIRKVIMELFEDKGKHHINEIRERCRQLNIDIESDKNAISNIIFKMKKNNILQNTGDKGVYELAPPTQATNNKIEPESEGEKKVVPECEMRTSADSLGKKVNLNWNDFFVLKPDDLRSREMRLTITDKGEIRFNSQLHKQLPNKKIQIIFSKDYRILLLNPDGEDAHIFTKAGTTKNRELIDAFLKLKLKFPVSYAVKWDEEYNMWKGKLDISDKK